MADVLKELLVKISADYTELTKAFAAIDTKATQLSKTLQKAGKSFTDAGKKLTIGLTVPIIAVGTAMVKFASDTGESLNAASVVFKGSTKTIQEWGRNAATQAGLTAAEFYQASAVIGAGLINAGASTEQAATQTIELTKRAADMASIFNTNVSDALGALQAGLRGESEPLRRFAVSLSEAEVAAKATALGLVDATGTATAYGKSQARLAIIMEQSSRFQGDFVKTSGELANKTRIVTAQVKEQAAQLGEQLLPAVLSVVSAISGAVKWFGELSTANKQTILTIAGVAAAIGPLSFGIGKLITTVGKATDFISKLSATTGTIGIVIVGVAALCAGLAILGAAIRAKEVERLKQDFGALAYEVEKAGGNVNDFIDKAGNIESALRALDTNFTQILGTMQYIETAKTPQEMEKSFKLMQPFVSQIADDFGVSALEAVNIGLASSKLTPELKKQLEIYRAQLITRQELGRAYATLAEATRAGMEQEKIFELKQKEYATQRLNLASALASKTLTQKEYNQQLLTVAQSEVAFYQDRIKLSGGLTTAMMNQYTAAKNNVANLGVQLDTTTQILAVEEKITTEKGSQTIALKKTTGEFGAALGKMNKQWQDAADERTKQIEAETNAWINGLQNVASAAANLFTTIISANLAKETAQIDAQLKKKITAIDKETKAKLKAAGLLEASEEEKLLKEIEIAQAAGDMETARLKQQELDRLLIYQQAEEAKTAATLEAEREKAHIKYQADLASWGVTLAMAIANGAAAVVTAFMQGGVVGWITGPLVAAAVGLQISNVAAAKPQAPAFAFGTTNAPPGFALVGEQGPELMRMKGGESIFTASNSKNLLNQLGERGITITINSPTAVTPMEASRILKNTMRQLAFQGGR